MELSLLRTFAPGSKSTMVWNFRPLELSLQGAKVLGTFAPRNFRSLVLSFPGAKVPRTFTPRNFRSLELSLPGTKVPKTFAPTPSDFRS